MTAVEGTWKHAAKLADGREIIYFDESPGLGRAGVADTRALPPPGEADPRDWFTRLDPLTGEWVVVAAARQDRTFLPPPGSCPLDPSTPGRPTEIPAPDYDVVVFENRFPSLQGAGRSPAGAGASGRAEAAGPGGAPEPELGAGQAAGPAQQRPPYGRCEVVCFSSDHDGSFAGLTPRRVRTVVEAWADRTAVLGAMPGVAEVYPFENRGEEIGVTLHHPHGQIYAFPFVTPRTDRMLGQAQAYAGRTGGNLFDDLVASEAASPRVVARNDEWLAFVPAAARWPYEVLLFPARRVPDIIALDGAARDGFCGLYLDVLRRLDALFSMPLPYIAAWHQAPAAAVPGRGEFGLHLQVLSVRRAPDKLKYLAGTESGAGVWINDVTPEEAARRIREAG